MILNMEKLNINYTKEWIYSFFHPYLQTFPLLLLEHSGNVFLENVVIFFLSENTLFIRV